MAEQQHRNDKGDFFHRGNSFTFSLTLNPEYRHFTRDIRINLP
ncbi:hypothetical protein BN133_1916 [Cronobacter dublinensis 582]|nr:hypothetical protein BN133_1916 [Cronobacter dublinensis 582]